MVPSFPGSLYLCHSHCHFSAKINYTALRGYFVQFFLKITLISASHYFTPLLALESMVHSLCAYQHLSKELAPIFQPMNVILLNFSLPITHFYISTARCIGYFGTRKHKDCFFYGFSVQPQRLQLCCFSGSWSRAPTWPIGTWGCDLGANGNNLRHADHKDVIFKNMLWSVRDMKSEMLRSLTLSWWSGFIYNFTSPLCPFQLALIVVRYE